MNSNNEKKQFITSSNESEQIKKLTNRIHVSLIVFLINYFDIINLLRSEGQTRFVTPFFISNPFLTLAAKIV